MSTLHWGRRHALMLIAVTVAVLAGLMWIGRGLSRNPTPPLVGANELSPLPTVAASPHSGPEQDADISGALDEMMEAEEARVSDDPVIRLLNSDPAIFARHQAEVEALRNETLEECLARLSDGSAYGFEGFDDIHFDGFPTHPWEGRDVPMKIMGNRRFLRMLAELSQLPEETAARLVSERIREDLEAYQRAYAEAVTDNEPLHQTGQSPGLSLVMGNLPDGSPSMVGLRLSLLSMVWLAGHHRLTGARDAVNAVLAEALEQRAYLYDYERQSLNERTASWVVIGASLYNRQVLATALVAMEDGYREAQELLDGMEDSFAGQQAPPRQWIEVKLTAFDALRTGYGNSSLLRWIPVDYTRGEQTVRVIPRLSDEEFDALVARFRK